MQWKSFGGSLLRSVTFGLYIKCFVLRASFLCSSWVLDMLDSLCFNGFVHLVWSFAHAQVVARS
jgi:hypothetical protein